MRHIKGSQYLHLSLEHFLRRRGHTLTHATMEIPKLLTLLCCACYCVASHHSHTIPVEGYDSELQDLGQHVEIPETPVKVIKITKTIAVKIPVPYPVKVREKVPYPVHVAKPYPVPVPQIIKVPHIVSAKPGPQHDGADSGNTYQVQEDGWSNGGNSFVPSEGQSYGGAHSGQGQSFDEFSHEGSPGSSFESPAGSYYGHSNSDSNVGGDSLEAKSYDQAIKEYFNKHQPSGNTDSSGYNYH